MARYHLRDYAGARALVEHRSLTVQDAQVGDLARQGVDLGRPVVVGDPDEVLAKLRTYEAMGIEAFVLSGYPHADECDLFGRYVLPHLDHAPLT